MAIKLQKWIDHYIGLPLCAVISLFARLDSQTPKLPRVVNTILVSKFFGIGSIALQLPLLRALRRHYPEARLVFMTFASNQRLLELSGLCDEILTVRPQPRHFVSDCLTCLRRLRFLKPDIGIDLEFFSKFAQLMCFFSGANFRIGLELRQFWRERMYHRMVPIVEADESGTNPLPTITELHLVANNPATESPNRPLVLSLKWKHILDLYGEVARAAGVEEYSDEMIPVAIPNEAHMKLEQLLHRHGWTDGEKLIAVNVNASELVIGRRWPEEKFAELIEWLVGTDDDGLRVILTGTKDEREYTERCRQRLSGNASNRVINAAGHLNLEEFLALLSMCDLLITNDTGPLHLAAMMGIPTVSLWGPGAPSMYAPRGPLHKTVYHQYWCSPCMYLYRIEPGTFCHGAFPCVRGIPVDEVQVAVRCILDSQPEAAG